MTQQITLSSLSARNTAKAMIDRAPPMATVAISEAKRSSVQNALMWTLLGYVSRAKPQGRAYPPEIWKCLFLDDVGHKPRWEPSLCGDGVVNTGYRSSRLSKSEMSDVIERIYNYGAENEIVFGD